MSAAAWVLRIDVAFCDARVGAGAVNRVLSDPRGYREAPAMTQGGSLSATLEGGAMGRRSVGPTVAVLLRIRLREEVLEVACACSPGRHYICEHVARVLVDLAIHRPLREALIAAAPSTLVGDLLAALPALRMDLLEERTLEERLAQWAPPRRFDDAFEIDVEPVASPGRAATDERPALLLRHRRPGARALIPSREVLEARLRPRHRRMVELTAPAHMDRAALVSTRAQASMLLQLLRDESPIFTKNWTSRLRFAKESVAPRACVMGDRLVARWWTADGHLVANAADALLFAGAFPFLWERGSGIFYPVASDVDLDAAWGLSRVPSLPFSLPLRKRVGQALLSSGGFGVQLPAREVFGFERRQVPSFELRLRGSPLDVRGELDVIYDAERFAIASRDGEPIGIGRDGAAEDQVRAAIVAAGFIEDSDGGALRASDEAAVDFWRRGIGVLRASFPRLQILLEEALTRVKVGPPVAVDVDVAVSSGWLETELTFQAGALKVELSALRRALAERGRWVVLSDASLCRIEDDIAELVDESRNLLDETGRGRLASHQLGRVERWLERFGGELDERAVVVPNRLRPGGEIVEARLPTALRATLRPYQRFGLGWLQFLQSVGAGGVLADDMGLGKTLMTLAFLARWKEENGGKPSLLVCPTSLVGNWAKEAERFTPQLRVVVANGPAGRARLADIESADLVIMTFGILWRDIERIKKIRFRAAVVDEAQNIKNPRSAAARAARRLGADMRLALSGTPVENRLSELWSIMSFANPGMLGERRAFEERYERALRDEGVSVNAGELRALVRPFVLRRTKTQVLPELPPKTELVRSCVLGLRQRRLYDALALALREAVKKNIEKRGLARSRLSVLTAILRLRQMACDPRLVESAALASDSTKRTAFLELVRDVVAEGRRALVFSQFVALFTLWREDLERERIPYEYLDGSTPNRESVVERFQSSNAPLFLISLKAGGAGLNLTGADTVIHCDPWWNPAVEDQATDRAHRIGQGKAVTVVRLVAAGTIEEKIGLLKEKKRALAASVLDDDAGMSETELTEEDVRVLLEGIGVDASRGPVAPDVVCGPDDSRFVGAHEVDACRVILKRIESSGTPREVLARRVGVPLTRLSLLLIGHRVPITRKAAARIRALQRP